MNEEDNYLIKDGDFVGNRVDKFNSLWRDYFSMLPPVVNMSAGQRKIFQGFAWEIYKEALLDAKKVQEIANKAYDDGVVDGRDENIKKVKEKLILLSDNLYDD